MPNVWIAIAHYLLPHVPRRSIHPSLRDTSLGGRHARADVCIAHARCNSRHGDLGGSHHFYGDGLHHLCESCHPELCWHARTRRSGAWLCPNVGRYLPGGWSHDGAHGSGDELSPRHGLRHGPERCGRLPACRRAEAAVARGHGCDHSGGDHHYGARPHWLPHCGGRRYSSGAQACYWRGHWLVHPVYRPVLGRTGETGHGHPGDTRRPHPPPTLVAIISIMLTTALIALGFRGALLVGVVIRTGVAIALNMLSSRKAFPTPGMAVLPARLVALPDFSTIGAGLDFSVFMRVDVVTAVMSIFAIML